MLGAAFISRSNGVKISSFKGRELVATVTILTYVVTPKRLPLLFCIGPTVRCTYNFRCF